ncbi:hypothetical protein OXX69_007146 [Metschnikowia pulcherrima]
MTLHTDSRERSRIYYLATVDFNSLIGKFFDGKMVNPVTREVEAPAKWARKAEHRKAMITHYLGYIHSSGVLMCLFRP